MPLGTLDRTPPPFFRQGPSALTKLVFFSALAVFLMVADVRFRLVEPLRAAAATALLPVQRTLAVPVGAIERASDYAQGLERSLSRLREVEAQLVRQTERTARVDQILAENSRLRGLLELRPALSTRSRAAEVMHEAADPFSRKVVIDIGAAQGVVLGSPVMNEAGVLGQVTRLYPLTAEVTLLSDRDAAIPVINARTQQRSAAFGGAAGGTAMELRFMSGNADVQPGDSLVTSGLDGVYPAGLPVATVLSVDRRVDSGFARVLLTPAAPSDAIRHVLVLEPLAVQLPPRPAPAEPERAVKGSRAGRP